MCADSFRMAGWEDQVDDDAKHLFDESQEEEDEEENGTELRF